MQPEVQELDSHSKSPEVHLNLNVRGLASSATLRINELSSDLIKRGKKVFRLGLGQSPFPVPESIVEGLRSNAYRKDYLPVKGLDRLREAVAEYHFQKNGIKRDGNNVLIGPGTKELMFLIQLVFYGDLVIPTPSWVSYAPQAQIIGRHVRWLPTRLDNNWRLSPDELEALCERDPNRPRLLILNYPNNPTGHTYDVEELRTLANLARRYRIVLLSDEIYAEIHHKGEHKSIAQFYPEGTIISSGLSKWCGAGGWRLGTFTFPDSLKWLMNAMAVVASETYTSTSTPIQYAAVEAFRNGTDIQDYLVHCRRILRALGNHCVDQLSDAGITVQRPEGAFYLFPSFTPFKALLKTQGISSSQSLCRKILENTGVASLPGSNFGRPNSNMTMRLAYVDFDGSAALTASKGVPIDNELDAAFLRRYCTNVTTSIDRICEWSASGFNGMKKVKAKIRELEPCI